MLRKPKIERNKGTKIQFNSLTWQIKEKVKFFFSSPFWPATRNFKEIFDFCLQFPCERTDGKKKSFKCEKIFFVGKINNAITCQNRIWKMKRKEKKSVKLKTAHLAKLLNKNISFHFVVVFEFKAVNEIQFIKPKYFGELIAHYCIRGKYIL